MSYMNVIEESYVSLYEDYLDKVENHIWEDKSGNEHKIEEMETSYLTNCLNKINREEDFRQEYKEIIEDELERRKDENNKENGKTALYNGILSLLDKYDIVSQAIEQPPKQEKWIVHRTLRTKGIEVYVCERKFANYSVISVSKDITHFTSHIKDNAIEFKDLHSATFVRDKLNETRKGKQYLWVVSKVEE